MTLADQNGFCLSQRMSQVQLETPKQTQLGGLEPLQPQQPHPWEQQVNGRTTFGLDDDSQDILCSQDFFCTPDYITPVEQQFTVDLEGKKENKENVRPQRSPLQITPVRSKRPRPDLPPRIPSTWSQPDPETSSQLPASENNDMSQDQPSASQDNEMEHSFHFDLGSSQGPPEPQDDAGSGDRMVTSSGGGRADFAGLAEELQAREQRGGLGKLEGPAESEKSSQGEEGFRIAKPGLPPQQRQPLFHAGSTGGGKTTPATQRGTPRFGGTGGSQTRPVPFTPSANAFRGGMARPGSSAGRPNPGSTKGRLGSQLLSSNPAAERNRKGPLTHSGDAVVARPSGIGTQAPGAIQNGVNGAPRPRSATIAMMKSRVQTQPCVKNPFLEEEGEAEAGSQKTRFTDIPPHAPASRYKEEFHEMKEIGHGNFSRVYKVRKRLDGCLYAMKRTRRELYQVAEKKVALTEVQALAAAGSHPNIVRYYNAWYESDHLYIQTELCERSLEVKAGETQVKGEPELLAVMQQMAEALHHLHGRGIAHLDLKPDNIYVLNGEYKLGDFGRGAQLSASVGVEEGDSRYMPQEILNSASHCDLAKVDVFSLGATLYELARAAPLPTSGTQYQAIRQGRLTLLPQLSTPFQALIKSLMHPDPAVRPSPAIILEHAVQLASRK